MTLKTGLLYKLQCQTNADPDSLTFTISSVTYNVTQQLMQNLTYISEVAVTKFTGTDVTVYCNWSINGIFFIGSDVIEGKLVLMEFNYLISLAPSSVPTISLDIATTISITVNWTSVPDANGYIVYVNNTAYSVIGSDNTSYTIDGLIPGTSYAIIIRAYQDILGPASMTFSATTLDGKCRCPN